MLTRRGWAAGAIGTVLAFTGRLLGLPELYALAGVAFALLIAALVVTGRKAGATPVVTRRIVPARVHVDTSCRVDVVATNTSDARTPVYEVGETFDMGRRYARFSLAPLDPGATAAAAYRLPTDQRGVFSVGPLMVDRVDALGLVRRSTEAVPLTKLTVYPRIDPIAPLPAAGASDPLAGTALRRAIGPAGIDFFALAEYQQGDDLRRVHWPSVAKTGELMIRQDETPWQGRTTVVLDLRSTVHDATSLEDVLSAAASVITSCTTARGLVRLVTTSGFDSGYGAGRAHVDGLLELLAAATPHNPDIGAGLAAVAAASDHRRHRSPEGKSWCVITTSRAARELGAVAVAGRHLLAVVFVHAADTRVTLPRLAGTILPIAVGGRGFAAAWNSRHAPSDVSRRAARAAT